MPATVLTLVILMASQAFAQWKEGSAPVPNAAWRKSSGTFGAMLFLTDDLEAFRAEWQKPGTPTIRSQDHAKRGEMLAAVVLFSGCRAKVGNCSVRADWQVLRPDGSEYAAQADTIAWAERAVPDGVIQVSNALLGIRIEPQDPAGGYRVRVRVRDVHAAATVDLERRFVVER